MGEKSRGTAAGRIEWCDIARGILIAAVVLTHATFTFNRYLNQFSYQFVIAGMFFLSGYTSRLRRRSVFEEVVRNFYRLMVPYYVLHFVWLWIFWAMGKLGFLSAVSTTSFDVSYGTALVKLLEGNNYIYCDWLGAMWFVPVLFWAEAIVAVLARICRKGSQLCLASFLVFLGAECLTARTAVTGVYYYSMDLAGIAQAFLVMGHMCHRAEDRIGRRKEKVWQLFLAAVILWSAWSVCIRLGFRYTFDWPSRDVNGPVDLLLPVFGILLTMVAARLFVKNSILKKLFLYLGKNSMGIMCFHFMGFKVGYFILILLGQMDAGEAYRLIPLPAVAKGWPLIFGAGIAVSIVIWRGLNRIPVVCVLLGGEDAGRIYSGMLGCRVIRSLKEVYEFLVGMVRGMAGQYREFIRNAKCLKMTAVLCLLCVAGVIGGRLSVYFGEIDVRFPCQETVVTFEGGWFPQGDTEAYRWFSRKADLKIFLVDQNMLSIGVHIPDTVENITYLAIRINGEEAYREEALAGTMIELELDMSEYVRHYRVNCIEIETDGIRIPKETDEDPRNFSARVDWIKIYQID